MKKTARNVRTRNMISVRRQPFRDKSNTKPQGDNDKVPSKQGAIHNKNVKFEQKKSRRKVNNYNELSLVDNATVVTTEKHVPIYLRNAATPEKRLKDPFKFVDSSKRQKNEEDSESDSIIYDKSMQEILRHIKDREKKKEKNKKIKRKAQTKRPVNIETLSTRVTSNPKVNVEQLPLTTSTPVQQKELNNINIVSNIQIQPPNRTPSPFANLDDNYPHDDWDYDLRDEDTQPWRGDNLNLRRNPHWLLLKDSSLPNYNQEMILEPQLIEKFSTTKPVSPKNSLVQAKITDYVESAPKDIEISNASSLFDDDSFSPLKEEPTKRVPFSPVNDDVINSKRRLELDFGFSFDDSDKENVSPVRRSSRKLPMRASPRKLKKVHKEAVERVCKEAKEKDVDKDVNISIPTEHDESVHLFEDLKGENPLKHTYAVKRRKKRIVSITRDNEEGKRKKKKKDLRTPAEEEEFNKWAANFNAMCDEVDQHSLEIT
ncbi:hypothetical protein RI129_003845 [Pyrocoelia pectoralis]|uniref:Uncharacterized protein n=1 Tax=Pyrocoelia pectoralis TaxID=417401 RepID=A0AAN7ZVI8_9COLE